MGFSLTNNKYNHVARWFNGGVTWVQMVLILRTETGVATLTLAFLFSHFMIFYYDCMCIMHACNVAQLCCLLRPNLKSSIMKKKLCLYMLKSQKVPRTHFVWGNPLTFNSWRFFFWRQKILRNSFFNTKKFLRFWSVVNCYTKHRK